MLKISSDKKTVASGAFFLIRITTCEPDNLELSSSFENVSLFIKNGTLIEWDVETLSVTLRKTRFFPHLTNEILAIRAGDPGAVEIAAVGEENEVAMCITVEDSEANESESAFSSEITRL